MPRLQEKPRFANLTSSANKITNKLFSALIETMLTKQETLSTNMQYLIQLVQNMQRTDSVHQDVDRSLNALKNVDELNHFNSLLNEETNMLKYVSLINLFNRHESQHLFYDLERSISSCWDKQRC